MSLTILALDEHPIHRIRFLNAAKRGGTVSETLPLLKGTVNKLPHDLDALLITSDLQGVVKGFGSDSWLLGEHLAAEYQALAEDDHLPCPEHTGVILAGDLYSAPTGDVRGASGDVRGVWQAFGQRFAWVAGVQGNHDCYGSAEEETEFRRQALVLDCEVVDRSGLRLGGIGGVMGDPARPTRKSEEDYLAALELVLAERPDLLILHEAPHGSEHQPGNPILAEGLVGYSGLTICGHVHWGEPLARLGPGQVLNVDKRAVLLTA